MCKYACSAAVDNGLVYVQPVHDTDMRPFTLRLHRASNWSDDILQAAIEMNLSWGCLFMEARYVGIPCQELVVGTRTPLHSVVLRLV
jgi:hypothetical protein